MRQTQYRATEVAKTLGRYIKADLTEGLSLALINRKFPGMTREELRASSRSVRTRRRSTTNAPRRCW